MPFIAMLWNQLITSPKFGLGIDALGRLGAPGYTAASGLDIDATGRLGGTEYLGDTRRLGGGTRCLYG